MGNRSPLKWIFKCAKPQAGNLLLLTILGALVSVCSVVAALASRNVIDTATGVLKGSFAEQIFYLAGLLIAQLALQSLFSLLYVRCVGNIRITLKSQLFEKILKKDWLSVNRFHSGDLLNRLESDINIVADSIGNIVPSAISLSVRIGMGLIVLFWFDPLFAGICMLLGPMVLIAAKLYRDQFKGLHKKYQESIGNTRSFMQDCLQSSLVIKSFGNGQKILSHLNGLQGISFRYSIKRNNVSVIANVLFFLTVTSGYYFALGWGAYKISLGTMTFGTLTAMLELVGDAVTPFRSVSALFPQYFQASASAERIIEIESLPDEADVQSEIADFAKLYQSLSQINVEHVSFSYGDETVIKDLTLAIKKGEFVAVGGISGVGKSTFLKLILGIIVPQKGDIYLQTDSRIPVGRSTRGLFSYVPQGNMILAGSIRDNIAFSDTTADESRVIACAKAAQIWQVIEALPQKLDTQLGEGGTGLSEGQVQRLAIARALYHGAPILLFDEATSALDKETELAVLKAIRGLKQKTLVIVTHRKEVMDFCDKVIHVDGKGFYVQNGPAPDA